MFGKSVSYHEFLQLYELFSEEISEYDFAILIGINDNVYYSLKEGKIQSTTIFSNTEPLSDDKVVQIQQKIIDTGKKNTLIDYEDFLSLYLPYKTLIAQSDFAKILGISDKGYRKMRFANGKSYVLKNHTISDERKEEIKKEFQNYPYKKVQYDIFLELYKPYCKELTEEEFGLLLGIDYEALRALKRRIYY